MSDVRKDELIRLCARRALTPEEESRLEAYFAENPSARSDWEEERALSRAMQTLPDIPISSNFTARVMEEIDLDAKREDRGRMISWLRALSPKLGWATAILLATALYLQHRSDQQERRAADIAVVSRELRRLPAPEVLQDFEVIERLSQAVPSDDELLVALQ